MEPDNMSGSWGRWKASRYCLVPKKRRSQKKPKPTPKKKKKKKSLIHESALMINNQINSLQMLWSWMLPK